MRALTQSERKQPAEGRRYGVAQIALHWTVVLLVIEQYFM